jgi:hypothetical protein
MGGLGSGRKILKKGIVEDCLIISVSEFLREGALVPGDFRTGTWGWQYIRTGTWGCAHEAASEPYASVSFESDLRYPDRGSLRLRYTAGGKDIDLWIWLTTTVPNYGGRRWWFRCPVLNIRADKLYLPRGGDRFASRKAWDLSYRSCQQSHKDERFYRRLAKRFGKDEEWVQAMLGR